MVAATLLVTAGAMAQNKIVPSFFPTKKVNKSPVIATLLMVNLLIS